MTKSDFKELPNIRAGIKNLIPFNKMSKERHMELSKKGGYARKGREKPKLAARLRHLRDKGLSDENAAWLHNMMTDSEMAALHILEYIQKLVNNSDKNQDINAAVKTTMDWYKIKHGTRENDSRHLVAVVNLTEEEKETEIIRLLED